jgi:hypothetical protein
MQGDNANAVSITCVDYINQGEKNDGDIQG